MRIAPGDRILAAFFALILFALILDRPAGAGDEETRELQKTRETELALLNELDDLERRMEKIENRLVELQGRSFLLEASLARHRKEIAVLEKDQARQEELLHQRLRILYRQKGAGAMRILLDSASISEFLHSSKYLASILAYDESLLMEYEQRRKTLEEKYSLIAAESAELNKLRQSLQADKKDLLQIRGDKTQLLMKAHQRKQTYLALIKAREEQRQMLVKEVIIEDDKGLETVAPGERLEDKTAKNLETGRAVIDFAAHKGKFPHPVQGRIEENFGRNPGLFGTYTTRQGITILAASGEPVRAISSGEVVFADWLKGYGNVVIINHGQRYYTLTAGATQVKLAVNQWVNQGSVLGIVPGSGKKNKNRIYLEIRHQGVALDPGEWLDGKSVTKAN